MSGIENKQNDTLTMTTPTIYNTSVLFGNKPTLAQYIVLNTFRILRPIRKKYKLSVTDVVILIGCYNYHTLEQSTFSLYSLRKFISYYNDNKILFHTSRLLDKGFIVQSDNFSGVRRYRITEKTIEAVSMLDESYNNSLYSFIERYNL